MRIQEVSNSHHQRCKNDQNVRSRVWESRLKASVSEYGSSLRTNARSEAQGESTNTKRRGLCSCEEASCCSRLSLRQARVPCCISGSISLATAAITTPAAKCWKEEQHPDKRLNAAVNHLHCGLQLWSRWLPKHNQRADQHRRHGHQTEPHQCVDVNGCLRLHFSARTQREMLSNTLQRSDMCMKTAILKQ